MATSSISTTAASSIAASSITAPRFAAPRRFVERFNGTILDEFFRIKMRELLYESFEALQADLDILLHRYNTEWPRLGYGS